MDYELLLNHCANHKFVNVSLLRKECVLALVNSWTTNWVNSPFGQLFELLKLTKTEEKDTKKESEKFNDSRVVNFGVYNSFALRSVSLWVFFVSVNHLSSTTKSNLNPRPEVMVIVSFNELYLVLKIVNSILRTLLWKYSRKTKEK